MDTTRPALTPKEQPAPGRLLLSSLADFWSLLEPLLTAAAPTSICEIGLGQGEFTRSLLGFCAKNNCRYAGIDPAADLTAARSNVGVTADFFQKPSLSVLSGLPAQDVYFVDGDHNHYTVINELRLILQGSARWPLVILHDVCWPWGRRDHYCSPETIPAEFRHPYSASLGVKPGRNELGPGGFSGEASAYAYGAAAHEGGPRNGVLTAVEDFLQEQPAGEWQFVTVPVVFGLGIVYAPQKCAPAVAAQLVRLEISIRPLRALLELMERNRVELFVHHLGLHGDYAGLKDAYDKLTAHATALLEKFEGLHQRYDELDAHSESLLSCYNSLHQHSIAQQKRIDELECAAQPLSDSPPASPSA